ncbi:AbiV family abortive infection protein [Chlorobium sp. BLA1]|uniref:AbiV family abortive infection protein n=1 Tax=Candidatus Chlorobium masyuteum TaxID=2716876 RepID=UPI0014213342|nr:AbiV family abortive infection protein [Candidatus Chlorobium masyuteum]NHQ60154.1 AbiV family abortive infection protein [Candidatus Chlorobium masyuteum]
MKPLAHKQVEIARSMILENARSLLEEAKLLYVHGFFARAYTLAHLSSEEIVKIPMIVRAVLDEASGIPYDWKKLAKRLNSHTKKIEATLFHDYLQTEIRADDSDVNDYKAALETIPDLNNEKNNSIYCNFNNGIAVSPLQQISADSARVMIAVSNARIEWIKYQEKHTKGFLDGTFSEDFLERLRKIREIMDTLKNP